MEKRTKIQKLEQGLEEVKALVKEFKQRNGNGSCRILNKDILFLLLQKRMEDDARISKLEAYVKVLLLLVVTAYGGIVIL
jgi:hypothetical protein